MKKKKKKKKKRMNLVWAHTTSSTWPCSCEVHVKARRVRAHVYVLEVSKLPLFAIFFFFIEL